MHLSAYRKYLPLKQRGNFRCNASEGIRTIRRPEQDTAEDVSTAQPAVVPLNTTQNHAVRQRFREAQARRTDLGGTEAYEAGGGLPPLLVLYPNYDSSA